MGSREPNREPYRFAQSSDRPCVHLPRELRGRSSIMYVDPDDAASKPRRYTVYVDEPIELPDG